MTSSCAALGSFARLLVQDGSAPRTFADTSERYSFLREGIQSDRPVQGRRKIVGSRDLWSASLRPHSYVIAGDLVLQPGPADLSKWLPRIFGGSLSGGVVLPADTLPTFDMLVDRENDIWLYTNCQVARALFTASTNLGSEEEELVELILTIVAETETDGQTWPNPEPAINNSAAYAPYANWEGALTINSSAVKYDSFNLMIDNNIFMRARGSLTPNCIRAGDRSIRLQTRNPFTSSTITTAMNAWSSGYAGTLKFTNGGMSTEFVFPHLRNRFNTPNAESKNEIPLALNLEAARTSSDPVVTINHDATP